MQSLAHRRNHLNAKTPVSVEREFSLFHSDARPASRTTTNGFMAALSSRLETSSRRYDVVEEVAGNSFEVKVCFSNAREISTDLRRAYEEIRALVMERGLLVSGISSPVHAGEFNDFFTTMAFPLTKNFLGRTNSTHLHIGGETEAELVSRYNAASLLAPTLLDISQSSIMDGNERGRAVQIARFLDAIPSEMALPLMIRDFDSFESGLEMARQAAERTIRSTINGNAGYLCSRFPGLTRMNGNGFELLRLTPDKLFSLARLRPDKKSSEYGLAGSVEIRSIDGQATLERDIAMIHLALGALMHAESNLEDGALSEDAISHISSYIGSIARNSMDSARQARALEIMRNAAQGLAQLGLGTESLEAVRLMVERPPYLNYSNMAASEAIKTSASQFIQSV